MEPFATHLAQALLFIFPAYCANAAPVIFGGGRPIDGGRNFLDGKPIFGAHKTFRGILAGLVIGTLVGVVQNILFQYNGLLGLALSLGALLGDLTKSFVKRRLAIPPGAPLPIADQLDFVLGAFLLSLLVSPPSISTFLIVLIVTPPIHLVTNFLAYRLGLKDTMW